MSFLTPTTYFGILFPVTAKKVVMRGESRFVKGVRRTMKRFLSAFFVAYGRAQWGASARCVPLHGLSTRCRLTASLRAVGRVSICKGNHTMTTTTLPQSFNYNSKTINSRDDMLSLTDMWKAAGSDPSRNPAEWLRSADATRLIDFLRDILNMGKSHIAPNAGKSGNELFKSQRGGKNPGTWAHWHIGLAYARYLSPEFHVWCNTVVRERMENKPTQPAIEAKPQPISPSYIELRDKYTQAQLDRDAYKNEVIYLRHQMKTFFVWIDKLIMEGRRV